MKKPTKSEKLFLEDIFASAEALKAEQKGSSLGQIISLIRSQLGMSQRTLAKRANIPQATISRIESGQQDPNITTLRKISRALNCELVLSVTPNISLERQRQKQAQKKAHEKIQYLRGTMSLEDQEPDKRFFDALLKEETKNLLDSYSPELWEELP